MQDERVEPGQPRLVLASASPRRQVLLARLGLPFEVVHSGSDEDVAPALAPELVVRQLARRKAELVMAGRPAAVVIGCDTIVMLDGAQIGKPVDAADAVATLRRLRGRPHWVYTGVAVIDAGRGLALLSALRTRVVMVDVDDATIAAYVATGEPMDKAGSYAAQGQGARLIERIDGCVANVVGLPLCELVRLLTIVGMPPPMPGCAGLSGEPCPRTGHSDS